MPGFLIWNGTVNFTLGINSFHLRDTADMRTPGNTSSNKDNRSHFFKTLCILFSYITLVQGAVLCLGWHPHRQDSRNTRSSASPTSPPSHWHCNPFCTNRSPKVTLFQQHRIPQQADLLYPSPLNEKTAAHMLVMGSDNPGHTNIAPVPTWLITQRTSTMTLST